METSPNHHFGSRRRDEPEFNLKEWALKARISRENTGSRRFSASNIKSSFREDARSFRSNFTISSTASSPGYTLKDEIDPSTYSFTTALKALQAKTVYSWEYMSPDGLALNSKWNEAEKYICNPYSGEVPVECLSAKTLSARSFRSLTSRITMSAPLIYPSYPRPFQTKPSNSISISEDEVQATCQDKKFGIGSMSTKDMGTQSTPPDISSGSPSPAPTPSIEERPRKCCEEEEEDSSLSSDKSKSVVVERREEAEEEEEQEEEEEENEKREETRGKVKQNCSCMSWSSWRRRRRQRAEKNKASHKKNMLVYYISGCQITAKVASQK